MFFPIDIIYIDERSLDSDISRQILSAYPNASVQIVAPEKIETDLFAGDLSSGKRRILLTVQQGGFVKPCPATRPPYLCCRYTVINQSNQCPMDCTYCVLQGYLERYVLVIYTNLQDMYRNIDAMLASEPQRFFRFGTGELADSLAFDPVIHISGGLIDYFSKKKNALIELKTKTAAVNHLPKNSSGNAVIAWSLNPQSVIDSQELYTAPLEKRLEAARQCQQAGFLLAFHFDPLVLIPDWEREYEKVVDSLFSTVDASRIAWISLGALRFPPVLKQMIRKRFPQSSIASGEMIRGIDGKYRYARPLRTPLFQKVYHRIKGHDPDVFVYFCMEPSWVWNAVAGFSPSGNDELDYWFAQSLYRRFPDLQMERPEKRFYRESSYIN